MGRVIRVGSRESKLAMIQAEIVIHALKKENPGIHFEIVTFKTTGDKILDQSLDKIGGKGLFIKELEIALLDEKIDIAVHSYKDLPVDENELLPIVAVSERENPFDALVSNSGNITKVGSSSIRRKIQLEQLNHTYEVQSVRGNVISRLQKLDEGLFDALVLAVAGLTRLKLQNRITKIFTIDEIVPSACQGILAVQGRKNDNFDFLEHFNDKNSEIASKAERRFTKILNGGCSSPIAAFAEIHSNEIKLTGLYVEPNGEMYKGVAVGETNHAEALAEELAIRLKREAI